MTKMDQMSIFEGETTPLEKPKSREEKIQEYRTAHASEYRKACDDAQCTCTPTKAQMLIMQSYESPPVD